MEVPPRIELGIRELQSHALPLGYGTGCYLVLYSISPLFVKRFHALQIRLRSTGTTADTSIPLMTDTSATSSPP